MARKWKRLLAAAAAVTVSCTAMTGFANTIDITKVVIKDGTTKVEEYGGEKPIPEKFEVNPSQMVEVTVKLSNGENAVANAEATFLSYLKSLETAENAEYNNSNIQYVAQEATDTEGTVTFAFRPRETIGTNGRGEFVAKAGGTDVTAPDSVYYDVVDPIIELTIAATNDAIITLGTAGDTAAYTLTAPEGKALPTEITVKLGETALTKDTDYTYANGTITIKDTALTTAAISTAGSYTISVAANGYNVNGTAALEVKPAQTVVVPDEDKEKVQEALNNIAVNANPEVSETGATVTLEPKAGEYDITYAISGGSSAISQSGTTITYTPVDGGKFAERVTVKATVGDENSNISRTYDIYFVKPGVTINFGNITAIAAADGVSDAFATADSLAAVNAGDITEARAKALNIVLGRQHKSTVAKAEDTLDYNGDDTIALAEYRIYMLMVEGAEGYSPEAVKAARAALKK